MTENSVCSVAGCGGKHKAHGLCAKHYMRLKKRGSPADLPPEIHGGRSTHPLYPTWWHQRKVGRVPRWDKFENFLVDVGQRPPRHELRRLDKSLPIGPDNFWWKPPTLSEEWDEVDAEKRRYELNRLWRLKHPHKLRQFSLKAKYGVTVEQYDAMLEVQGGVCAICFSAPTKRRPLAVDHCHDKKHIRGLLCIGCNTGIGSFKDNPARLIAAIDYLQRTKGPQ